MRDSERKTPVVPSMPGTAGAFPSYAHYEDWVRAKTPWYEPEPDVRTHETVRPPREG